MTTTDNDRLLLNAYIDGELDPAHALEFEQRLAATPTLAEERRRIEALRNVLRERLPRATASLALRRRVTALAQSRPFTINWPGWAALAASAAIAFAGGSIATQLALGPASREPRPELLIASHMRALMASQAVDVASSDRHTVKPWFNGKLPESPRVVDLGPQGYPLVGGRIDVIDLVPVPTLVYRRRLHVISLSALPAKLGTTPPRAIDGYNIVDWTDGDISYWAVSDVSAPDLAEFTRAFRAGEAEP